MSKTILSFLYHFLSFRHQFQSPFSINQSVPLAPESDPFVHPQAIKKGIYFQNEKT
jgi:hypothetical protein